MLIAMIIATATYKYVSYGETYKFETSDTEEKLLLNGNIISQEIVIDEKATWTSDSYSVYLHINDELKNGYITVTLTQNVTVQQGCQEIPINVRYKKYEKNK